MGTKQSLSEEIYQQMLRGEPFQDTLLESIKNPEFVSAGMHEIWAGSLRYANDPIFDLLKDNVLPNEKSKLVEQIFFYYNCFDNRREELSSKMNFVIQTLEKTEEGRKSIVDDIEKYFQYYGKVLVGEDVYPFIEPIYQQYAENKDKIYYLETINVLKFLNTLSKPLNELPRFERTILPLLAKIVDTPYWNQAKKIKFMNPDNQVFWEDFCKEYKEKHSLNESQSLVKNKIKP